MRNKLITISLIILVLLGLVIPNLPFGQTESKALASESEIIQEPLLKPFPLFPNSPDYWWQHEFFTRQIREKNQIQDIDPFSPNLPWNNLQPEIGPDGTVRFKPNESKPFSANPESSSISTFESSGTEDLEAPQLLSFNFTPKNIDTKIGPQTVTFTLRTTDNLSGFSQAWWYLNSPSGQQIRGGYVSDWSRISGDALDGIYQSEVELPQYSEAGTWYVGYISLVDKVGNLRFFNEQDLINLHFPTKIENGRGIPSDLGFRANPNGFKFQNFSTSRTWEMFERFFGKSAVTLPNGDRRYTAEQYFKEHYSQYMGSCDGFSGASLINFKHLDQPNAEPFAMPYYETLFFQDLNDDIKNAITYQQGFPFSLKPISYVAVLEKESNNSPTFFSNRIKEAIQNREPVVLWIWEEPEWWGIWQEGGGHALVPYRYKDISENEGWVYVYDSNHPGDNNRKVVFNLKNDTWSYEFQKFWWIFSIVWEGDSSYLSMATIPLSMRLLKGVPPWNQEVSPYAYLASVEGPARPLFTDQNGNRIGFVDGEFVNEISDATYVVPLAQDQDKVSGLYYLPEESDYTVTISGTDEETMDFRVISNQLLVEITNATIHSSTIDTVKIGKGYKSLTYTTNDDYKEYSAAITEEFPDMSRIVKVNTDISSGDTTTLEITNEQTFKYVNRGNTKTYNLLLEQRGTGTASISFPNLEIGANETQSIEVVDWNNLDTTEIILNRDKDSDGTVDETETLQITFEDQERGTKIIINIPNKTFQFVTPDKEFPIKKADWMRIIELSQQPNVLKYNSQQRTWSIDNSKLNLDPSISSELKNLQFKKKPREIILIKHRDEEITLSAVALTGEIDFCLAQVKDVKMNKHYLLIDKVGKE